MINTNNVIRSITPESEIKQFVGEYDVAVCGYGGAGGCASLEASRNNAKVILFERASDGGGSTAYLVVKCILEVQEGTSLQNACKFDSNKNMIAYIEASLEGKGDPKKIKLYCENAASHFEIGKITIMLIIK